MENGTNKATIDKDVLDILKDEEIMKSISDETQFRRLELNFFCEFLSQMKELNKEFDEFTQLLSVVSADKLAAFFKELNKNVSDEEKRIELQGKLKESHKKSAKK